MGIPPQHCPRWCLRQHLRPGHRHRHTAGQPLGQRRRCTAACAGTCAGWCATAKRLGQRVQRYVGGGTFHGVHMCHRDKPHRCFHVGAINAYVYSTYKAYSRQPHPAIHTQARSTNCSPTQPPMAQQHSLTQQRSSYSPRGMLRGRLCHHWVLRRKKALVMVAAARPLGMNTMTPLSLSLSLSVCV